MDTDSSSKFIGSLTKFLQSLCNGYVEFQRGVELVGHIYLSIDTGEKVDYILHEKVSKNDENSVTFVSNSFHAQPLDKEKAENKDNPSKSGASSRGKNDSSDDDDIMIVDQSKGVPGSSNSGSIPSRGVKRVGSPNFSERHAQRIRGAGGSSSGFNRGSSSFQQNNRQHSGPSATVTSQTTTQQESLDIGDVKLEQISKDELMSLASQVGEGGSRPSHAASSTAVSSHSSRSEGGLWIKQEAADDDDDGGGNETGWSHGRDDSNSNSGSNLYPVMLHQNPAAYSGSAFPGFSGPGSSGSQSAANPYGDPLPGTSQDSSGLDPSVWFASHAAVSYFGAGFPSHPLNIARDGARRSGSVQGSGDLKSSTLSMRRYRQKLKQNPEMCKEYRERQLAHQKRYMARKKQRIMALASAMAQYSSQAQHMMVDRSPSDLMSRSQSEVMSRSQSEVMSGSQSEVMSGSQSEVMSGSQSEVMSGSQSEVMNRSQTEVMSRSPSEPSTFQSDPA